MPPQMSVKQKGMLLTAFAFIANIPDLPLDRYINTHSIFTTTIVVAMLVVLAKIFLRKNPYFTNRILLGGALAWFSHLLLDTMYNKVGEQGYEMFWPISNAKAALPIPWLLQSDKINVWSLHNASVAFFEILTFGTVLVLAILTRHWLLSNHQTRKKPVQT